MLARFSIIVSIDSKNGMAKNKEIPWNNASDMKFFRETTMGVGSGKNAIIMGRVTYENIPENNRPLAGRKCIVISSTWKQENHPEINIYPSLVEALTGLGAMINSYNEIFIAGGEQLFSEAISKFLYLCDKVYVTRFKDDYKCDQNFPFDQIKHFEVNETKTRDYNRSLYFVKVKHDEYQYLDLIQKIKDKGEPKPDRTGIGTTSLFGEAQMVFDIRDSLPIITTRKIPFELIIKELLFFISGKTDTKLLEEQKVRIWRDNTSRKFLDSRGLKKLNEGDMGAGYGYQWRHWNAPYEGCHADYKEKGIDQLKNLIKGIRDDPFARRHILTAWNPEQIDQMALPPCHMSCQFNVSGDRKFLDCMLVQRSFDVFLGGPWNITSYCILTYMIAHITGLRPRKFIHSIGDAHIYNNHGAQINTLLKRTPRPFPRLSFRTSQRIHEIDDFTFDNFIIEGYNSWPAISGDMAI